MTATIGDNSGLAPTAQGKLKSFVERLERLAEDRAAVMADMNEVFAEAKNEGFQTKIIRAVLKLRAEDDRALYRCDRRSLTVSTTRERAVERPSDLIT
jgi:uncharacterized protein (UPF0335 family)